jgi:hypothetical protein
MIEIGDNLAMAIIGVAFWSFMAVVIWRNRDD